MAVPLWRVVSTHCRGNEPVILLMAEKFSEEHYHAVYAPVLLMTHYGLLFSVVFSQIKKKKLDETTRQHISGEI